MILLVLVCLAVALLLLRAVLCRSTGRRERAIGLQHRTVMAADDSRLGARTLRSARFRLVGRPDHLVRVDGATVPMNRSRTPASYTNRTCSRSQRNVCLSKRS